MQFDRSKLQAVILYTCAKCDPSHLGAVKLHKVLYFTDMLQYAATGSPVTGATYRKRPFGPTCDQLLATLRELEKSRAISVQNVEYFGYWKKEFVAHAAPDTTRLKQDEMALLDEVIDFVCARNTAKTISEFSHNRAWEMAEFGDELPYRSAYLLFPTQASPEALDWGAAEEGAIAKTGAKEALAGKDFAVFRGEVLQRLGA